VTGSGAAGAVYIGTVELLGLVSTSYDKQGASQVIAKTNRLELFRRVHVSMPQLALEASGLVSISRKCMLGN